jgi:hypothetical protein
VAEGESTAHRDPPLASAAAALGAPAVVLGADETVVGEEHTVEHSLKNAAGELAQRIDVDARSACRA